MSEEQNFYKSEASEKQNFSKNETSEQQVLSKTEIATLQTIESLLKIPMVKVTRDAFLLSIFEKKDENLKERILADGPVEAGVDRDELYKIARNLIFKDTTKSAIISFFAGMPGGLALPLTISADTTQFFGFAMHMAQKIAYLYGEKNLWEDGSLNSERVSEEFVLYCGVMLGASGASAGVRVLASRLSTEVMIRLPKVALTKTLLYPIIKNILKYIGIKLTKETFAKAVAKLVPIFGGAVSAVITFLSMRPMGLRLIDALDEAKFSYTVDKYVADVDELTLATEESKKNKKWWKPKKSFVDEMRNIKKLLEDEIITKEEYDEIKKIMINKL